MRTLTGKAITKFYKEFPFMETVLDSESAQDPEDFKLKVQVSVANPECLYIIPRFCLPPHWIGNSDEKYVGRYYPTAYAFDSNNREVNRLRWNYDHRDHFFKEVITGQDTETIVLVMKYLWSHYVKDWMEKGLSTYVGKFSHSEYEIFIYKKPTQGFVKLVEESDLTKNVPIRDLLSICLAGDRGQKEAKATMEALEALVDRFEKGIGVSLWKRINRSRSRGMSGVFGKTELKTFTTAGRIMLSNWSGIEQITFVGDESDYTRTGLQSINCSVNKARFIIEQVITNWDPSKLLADDQVGIC